jgi:fermentation-respiration switch protein FrsA (DUF1100 family)
MENDSRQFTPTVRAVSRRQGNRAVYLAWRLGRWPIIFYLLAIVLLMIFEESFVFLPSPYPEGDWQAEGLPVEDAWFESPDGLRLHGWYLPRPDGRAAALFCHGNAGNVTDRIETMQRLHDRVRVSVLVFDYRGYGRSEGKPSEAGVVADARAARAWLARREGIGERDIVMMGESLGGAVAVDLAAADGARALVLESTFSSLPDVAAHHYPFFPVRLLMRMRLDSLSKIGRYHGPLLQVHGDADTIVPYPFGRRLFEAANEPKQLITVPGGEHNAPPPSEYYQALAELLERR